MTASGRGLGCGRTEQERKKDSQIGTTDGDCWRKDYKGTKWSWGKYHKDYIKYRTVLTRQTDTSTTVVGDLIPH